MSNDLNNCTFIGRLGKDPEVRYLPNGDPVANFNIACGWKTKEKEGTEWIRVTAFGKLAEICGEYLTKGKQVFLSGRMQTRKYTDKDGQDRYTTEIVADRMQMLGSKSDDSPAERPQQRMSQPAASAPAPAPIAAGGGFDDMEDDIPF